MQLSFSEAIRVLLPHLPPALLRSDSVQELIHLANFLTWSDRGGFEVRLAPSAQVDLQQRISSQNGGPQRIREMLQGLPGSSTSAKWARVDAFIAAWGDTSSIANREIPELWLELDNLNPSTNISSEVPLSLFLGLKAERSQDGWKVIQEALDGLLGEVWRDWQNPIDRCFQACEEEALVSHVGVMLGRTAPALRINIKQLSLAELPKYLENVGWPGNIQGAMTLLHSLESLGGFTVCLDVGATVFPQIAFECAAKRIGDSHDWSGFLECLVERGWCLPEKKEALLQWPGFITPANSEVRWPASLIRASLLKPVDQFTVLERQMSHIKLTLQPEGSVQAKGYFGYIHQWQQPNV